MKRLSTLVYHIIIFVLAQVAWFSLLGLWIYWYVSTYIIFSEVGEKLAPQIKPDSTNIFALVSGLILLVVISLGMSLIFAYLNRQLSLTRLYDNFISNITHELKSPLSSIQLYLETMYRRQVPREKQQEFLSLMIRDTERLNNLINSILYLSALEQRKIARKMTHDYHIYTADSVLIEMIKESVDQLQISENSLKIEGTAPYQCVIDKSWLKIVFDNLFDNAIKYSRGEVKITVEISHTNKRIIIKVSDKGIGIRFKDQQKIFNKFQRIDQQESPNVKGTGLGLYWVAEIIKYHGGKVSVFSLGMNKGTTFKIELPIYKAYKRRYIKNLLKISKQTEQILESENE